MDTIDRGAIAEANEKVNPTLTKSNADIDVEKGVSETPSHTTSKDVTDDGSSSHSHDHTSPDCQTCASSTDTPPPLRGLSFLDRFLVIWILLAMALGIILSNLVPSTGPALQKSTFVGVSVPIAVGLLVMMYPILCKVRYETLHLLFRSREIYRQLLISIALNWIAAPLLMTGLAWAFLPDRDGLREGLIFVGLARCIAMVLIWNDLAGGDSAYAAVLVAVNSILQMVLFAPLGVFYIKIVSHDASGPGSSLNYSLVAKSVAVFLGIPLGAGILTRLVGRYALGERNYQHYVIRFLAPWSLIGLLYTIVVLFGSQGAHVVSQITSVLRVCAPLVVYFAITFSVTLLMCYKAGFGYKVSTTQSFTCASNNFELAIAVVVAVYGAGSEQALASSVGPLIEVPVLVGCVYLIKWVRRRVGWKD